MVARIEEEVDSMAVTTQLTRELNKRGKSSKRKEDADAVPRPAVNDQQKSAWGIKTVAVTTSSLTADKSQKLGG